jgi:transposase
MGVYNPKDGEVVIRDYGTLNREGMIDFLKELRRRNRENKVPIICDNARYQHAGEVKEATKRMNIALGK